MNFTHLIGNLGADPETRVTPGGQKVTSFRMATRSFKNGAEEAVWWRVTVWGEDKKIVSHLKKGSRVIVVGEMQKPTIYTNKEGQPQISLDLTAEMIRFAPGPKPGESGESGERGAAMASYPQERSSKQYDVKEEDLDDLPF